MLSASPTLSNTITKPAKRPKGVGGYLRILAVGITLMAIFTGGCSLFDDGHKARSLSREANIFFNQGDYAAALETYGQIVENHPEVADRVLFEMGIVHAYPQNQHKDYQKALECFQELLRDYPDSTFRHDSRMMILQIQNVILKDQIIARQKARIEASGQAVKSKADEILELQTRIEALEDKVFALRTEPADKVLIEKQERRLTLLSKGEVIRTYKIALGGNPVGPKERQGDNKTPEGIYIIDARNDNSGYHLALHISYPNEKDKMRARELGVSPGGDIMIHGLKNDFPQVGAAHAQVDWTEGCIAVTNREMEEIYKFVPNGTIVEIRP